MKLQKIFVLLATILPFVFAASAIASSGNSCTVETSPDAKRVAIVIGNAAYPSSIGTLKNPANDANAIADMLKKLGFAITKAVDADAAVISDCVEQGLKLASEAEIAIFYYSGHGVQIDDQNYLVGLDAKPASASKDGFVSVRPIVEKMQTLADATLVFLDACRNNPMSTDRSGLSVATAKNLPRGLVPEKDEAATEQARGLLVAYATSPNTIALDGDGNYSPFTKAIIKSFPKPGYSVQRAMSVVTKDVGDATQWSQTPWVRSSLTSEVFLNGGVEPEIALRASNLKASESLELLRTGLRREAIVAALQGLPEHFTDQDTKTYKNAYNALYRAVRSWNLRLPVHPEGVHLSFSADGKRVATVPMSLANELPDASVKLWDAESRNLIAELLPPERSRAIGSTLGAATFSDDSKLVAIIDPKTGFPMVWNARTGILAHELSRVPTTYEDRIILAPGPVRFSHSGNFLLAAGNIYALQSEKVLASIKCAKFFDSDEGNIVCLGNSSSGNKISRHSIVDQKEIWSQNLNIGSSSDRRTATFLSKSGKKIGFVEDYRRATIIDIHANKIYRFDLPNNIGSTGFEFSPDESKILVISDAMGLEIGLIDIASGKLQKPQGDEVITLDNVYTSDGAYAGSAYPPHTGNAWRAVSKGPSLFDTALETLKTLGKAEFADIESGRVRFR